MLSPAELSADNGTGPRSIASQPPKLAAAARGKPAGAPR